MALLLAAGIAQADDFQGTLGDWKCVPDIAREGRAKVMHDQKSCSLSPNYSREAYGIVTDDRHYYKLDDAGRNWALRLLKNSPNKDRLVVLVRGKLQGDTIQVTSMSEL